MQLTAGLAALLGAAIGSGGSLGAALVTTKRQARQQKGAAQAEAYLLATEVASRAEAHAWVAIIALSGLDNPTLEPVDLSSAKAAVRLYGTERMQQQFDKLELAHLELWQQLRIASATALGAREPVDDADQASRLVTQHDAAMRELTARHSEATRQLEALMAEMRTDVT